MHRLETRPAWRPVYAALQRADVGRLRICIDEVRRLAAAALVDFGMKPMELEIPRDQLEALATKVDEEYLDELEARDGVDLVVRTMFGKARALAALVFAGERDERHAAVESIYELGAVSEEVDAKLLERVTVILSATSKPGE